MKGRVTMALPFYWISAINQRFNSHLKSTDNVNLSPLLKPDQKL
jgi:hypothetical protein